MGWVFNFEFLKLRNYFREINFVRSFIFFFFLLAVLFRTHFPKNFSNSFVKYSNYFVLKE